MQRTYEIQDDTWYYWNAKPTCDEKIAKGLALEGKAEGKCSDLKWLKREAIDVYLTMNEEKMKFMGLFGKEKLQELGHELEQRALQIAGWEHLMDVPDAWRERAFQVLIKQAGANLSRHPLSRPFKSRGDPITQPSKVGREKRQRDCLLADAPSPLPNPEELRRRYKTSPELKEDTHRRKAYRPAHRAAATTTGTTIGSPRTQRVTVSYINPDGRVKKKRLERRYIDAWKNATEELAGMLDCNPDQVLS